MTEDLRVDTGLVREAGGRLQAIAADLPEPPAVHRPSGADALSAAIAAKVSEVVDPVIAQMPVVKEALNRYAQNVVSAAGTYDAVDRQLGESIQERVEAFDNKFGRDSGSGGGAGSGGAGAPSSAGTVSPAVGGAIASPTLGAGGASQSGQLGQMMQMPMQMAQQAAQAPMQVSGMAGGLVQAAQQGVQQAVQQASQLAETTGEETANASDTSKEAEAPRETAAAGSSGNERAPESLAPTSTEQSRASEEGPEITL